MSENATELYVKQILNHLTIAEDANSVELTQLSQCGDLIRFHSVNLNKIGDVSIAGLLKNWEKYCNKYGLCMRSTTKYILADPIEATKFMCAGQNWIFALAKPPVLTRERYILRLQRKPIIAYVLRTVLDPRHRYAIPMHLNNAKNQTFSLQSQPKDDNPKLLDYRAALLRQILRRVLQLSKWTEILNPPEPNGETLCISVNPINNNSNINANKSDNMQTTNNINILTGAVIESSTKIPTTLTKEEYIELRSSAILMMAMGRNSMHDINERNSYEFRQKLGSAAVTVELFEVRHISPVTVVRSGMGCSKGAPYILYNSARLETLLREFNQKVEKGIYKELPTIDKLDLIILEDDIDWQIIYGYLLMYPRLITTSLDGLRQGHFDVHIILRFTMELVTLFSRYYRQKKVLLPPREQLLPTIYARIYLIKAIRVVLNSTLDLLGIEPVDFM